MRWPSDWGCCSSACRESWTGSRAAGLLQLWQPRLGRSVGVIRLFFELEDLDLVRGLYPLLQLAQVHLLALFLALLVIPFTVIGVVGTGWQVCLRLLGARVVV